VTRQARTAGVETRLQARACGGTLKAKQPTTAESGVADTRIAEVSVMEEQRCSALTGQKYDALAGLIHDDLMYTHSNAVFDTKSSLLQALRAGDFRYRRIDRSDIRMKAYGETVHVTGIADMDADLRGQPVKARVRYSIIWVKGPQGWQYALWHAVPLPG
jgi:hypothetical protein